MTQQFDNALVELARAAEEKEAMTPDQFLDCLIEGMKNERQSFEHHAFLMECFIRNKDQAYAEYARALKESARNLDTAEVDR